MTKTTLTHGHTIMRWRTAAGALVLSGLLATVALGQATPSAHETHHPQPSAKADDTQATGSRCQQMMAAREKMMSDISSMNARFDELVARMDATQGDAKVAAMGAVVRELLVQRTRMAEVMTQMQPKMMAHMMEHAGPDTQEAKDAMAQCPMMKAIGAPPDGSGAEDKR